jgi:diguanylate cyclase (GGDEF)-like protein
MFDMSARLETGRGFEGPGTALWAGRLLLLVTGLVVTASVPLLHPDGHDWLVIGVISTAMLALVLATFAPAGHARREPWLLIFPASVILALALLGRLTSASIGSCYLGLFVLCFAYVGAFCPPHAGLLVLVPAAPGYVVAADRWDTDIAIRLGIGMAVWVVLAEVLAALMRRQRQVTELLRDAARTDALTGVGNRRDLDERVAACQPGDTVVICDLDHFKLVNDTLGHAAGDRILRDFGATLVGCLRGDDYAGRYGGDEFVLILADTGAEESRQVLERLRRKWAEAAHHTSFSAGSCTRLPWSSPAEALSAADLALYAAKAAGRDRSLPSQPARPVSAS